MQTMNRSFFVVLHVSAILLSKRRTIKATKATFPHLFCYYLRPLFDFPMKQSKVFSYTTVMENG